jgi:hypothetical protein
MATAIWNMNGPQLQAWAQQQRQAAQDWAAALLSQTQQQTMLPSGPQARAIAVGQMDPRIPSLTLPVEPPAPTSPNGAVAASAGAAVQTAAGGAQAAAEIRSEFTLALTGGNPQP